MSIKWIDNIDMDAMLLAHLKANEKALEKTSFVILSDVLNKSPRPPILTSALWGSGSVFVGSRPVAFAKDLSALISRAEPNTDLSETDQQKITIGFNIVYAEPMHENEFNWGPVSRQAGGVGSQFLRKHVEGDAPAYLLIYAEFVKQDMGL